MCITTTQSEAQLQPTKELKMTTMTRTQFLAIVLGIAQEVLEAVIQSKHNEVDADMNKLINSHTSEIMCETSLLEEENFMWAVLNHVPNAWDFQPCGEDFYEDMEEDEREEAEAYDTAYSALLYEVCMYATALSSQWES